VNNSDLEYQQLAEQCSRKYK